MKSIRIVTVCLAAVLLAATGSAESSLKWEPREIKLDDGTDVSAELGRLSVPLIRKASTSPGIELAFIRFKSTSARPGNPIVYLPGGPGGSATPMATSAKFVRLRALGDLILLDQRGTGMSSPKPLCPAGDPSAVAFIDQAAHLSGVLEAARRCADEWRSRGIDPNGFTTEESADDLEDLRKAIGAEKIDLIGFSYGTHLGLSAIRRHGDRIGRAVLLGIEGPGHTRKLPSTTDTQIARLSSLASPDRTAAEKSPDLRTLLVRVLEKLEKKPITLKVKNGSGELVDVKVGKSGLQRILSWDIGDGNDFPMFPAMLELVAKDDGSILSRYLQKRVSQMSRGFSLMPYAMDCASGASSERDLQIRREAGDALLGNVMNFPFPEICRAIGVRDLGPSFRAPIRSEVPTLFISGTLDNNTPPFQAEEVRWGFSRSTHLIVENAGHEDTMPNPEVQKAIVDFLRGQDVAGRRIVLPAPEFLTVEDAIAARYP